MPEKLGHGRRLWAVIDTGLVLAFIAFLWFLVAKDGVDQDRCADARPRRHR
jgi:hypothetical protein